MNITMNLKDPNSPNNATLYFDSLSFKPDAVVVLESKTPMSAIIGGVVGGVALLVAFGILFYLWFVRRKKQKEEQEKKDKEKAVGGGTGSDDPLVFNPAATNGGGNAPMVAPSIRSPAMSQRPFSGAEASIHSPHPTPSIHTPHPPSVHSPQFERRSLHQSQPSYHTPSIMSGGSNGLGLGGGADLDRQNTMLPAYPTSDNQSGTFPAPPPTLPTSPISRPMSPITDLESFARANPYLIDTVLLEKLRKARYSPLTNPNALSEAEWFEQFNVNKLEYERICEAYAQCVSLFFY
jgi:hypothetical protein